MKYLPAVAIALSVGGAVSFALYITGNALCLLGLFFLWMAEDVMPSS